MEHAVVFGSTDEVQAEDLPDAVIGLQKVGSPRGYHDRVREAKRNIVRSALEQAAGSYSEAAQSLGIHVNNLHRLIRELELKTEITGGRASAATVPLRRD